MVVIFNVLSQFGSSSVFSETLEERAIIMRCHW